VRPAAKTREEAIAADIEARRIIGTQGELDDERLRKRAEIAYDRCYYPIGTGRQIIGIMSSRSRVDGLRKLKVPTLVIHGTDDPLVGVSAGERTAELIPGAELVLIEGMGHDLPPVHWPKIIESITMLAGKVEANG
jgi:pimeloyl-ACP methyl ester carboxylesterase